MTILKYNNDVRTVLANSISAGTTIIQVGAGTGNDFPAIVDGVSSFYCTILDAATLTQKEIVWCYSRTGDYLTVARGQQGTSSPASWPAGSIVAQLITAGDLTAFLQQAQLPDAINPPIGSIMYWATTTAPTAWLFCDGSSVLQASYPLLYDICGTTFGTALSGYFKLPDLRGEFVRGWNNTGAGLDAGRAFASTQTDLFKAHTHTITTHNGGNDQYGWVPYGGSGAQQSGSIGGGGGRWYLDGISALSTGGTDTRPANIALMPIIRALA